MQTKEMARIAKMTGGTDILKSLLAATVATVGPELAQDEKDKAEIKRLQTIRAERTKMLARDKGTVERLEKTLVDAGVLSIEWCTVYKGGEVAEESAEPVESDSPAEAEVVEA